MRSVLILLCAAIGYLLGSINSSLVIGKIHGIDIRKHGSGNAGLTNTLRTLGKKSALAVLTGDALKGIASCLLGLYIAQDIGLMVAGLGAILGHNWPLYFNFKGGKGVLVSISVLFMMDWKIAIIVLIAFVIVVVFTRFVSLGSIIGATLFPIIAIVLRKEAAFIAFAIGIGLLVIVKHKSNIGRILKGTESKLGDKGLNR